MFGGKNNIVFMEGIQKQVSGLASLDDLLLELLKVVYRQLPKWAL
jgi:hypothetical protein